MSETDDRREYQAAYYQAHAEKKKAASRARSARLRGGPPKPILSAEERLQRKREAQKKYPFGRAPNLDHDHVTGQARGFLCTQCNQAIGMLKDSPARLRAAAAYLERHQPKLQLAHGALRDAGRRSA